VGHEFNENLSGTVNLTWDQGVGTGADITSDCWTVGLGGEFKTDLGTFGLGGAVLPDEGLTERKPPEPHTTQPPTPIGWPPSA
jgi:hypothetical protein